MHIEYNIELLKKKAESNRKSNQDFFNFLKTTKPKNLDQIFQQFHYKIFKQTDCLKCGNCCRTLGPLLTNKDIDKLATNTKQKSGDFISSYLRIDEDNDYVFKTMPCPFLNANNYCSVYPYRPNACAAYPHTDQLKMMQVLDITLKNSSFCPAVFAIIELIKQNRNLLI